MQRLDVERRPVDPAAYRGNQADVRHVAQLVEGPAVVHVDGDPEPGVVYLELSERQPAAVAALRSLPIGEAKRTSGMYSRSETFGYMPKAHLRGAEVCMGAAMQRNSPAAHAAIAGLAGLVEAEYRRFNASRYALHESIVAQVLPDWRLDGGVFTSGIVNKNNRLPYHYDAGNSAACWSNMLVFRAGCTGGELVCPELGLAFRLAAHSLLMFDGQAILHVVAPFRMVRPDGYRYSVVFYSLRQMWRCEPPEQSAQLQAQRRTARERRRFATP